MTDNVVVFYGSKRDFNDYLESVLDDESKTIPFMELIQHYNARLRPNESGVRESALARNIKVDNCIVRADDYGSVLEHVLSNFVSIVTLNHDIGTLYVQNPPRRVLESLQASYGDMIQYEKSEYLPITREKLREIYTSLQEKILGQETCKKEIISGLYRLMSINSSRPAVIMLYGPSGVGKTETAKCISESMGGELLRIQFSMMQTNEAFNYVFGAEHSKASLARDLMGRESNVVLIDEFDKVNQLFYNAFYELFDEGNFVDSNYDVDLNNTIFVLTSNFLSESEIKKMLGPAMYSRISVCIEYQELTIEEKKQIIESWYNNSILVLQNDERDIIEATDIKQWFLNNAGRYDNIRILKNKIELAIYDKLSETFIFNHG